MGLEGRWLVCVLEIQPDFEPPSLERRDLFGVTLEQPRHTEGVRDSLLKNVVTKVPFWRTHAET